MQLDEGTFDVTTVLCALVVPNVISPNQDAQNERFALPDLTYFLSQRVESSTVGAKWCTSRKISAMPPVGSPPRTRPLKALITRSSSTATKVI